MTEEITENQELKTEEQVENKETLKLPEKSDKLLDLDNMTEEQIETEAKKWGHIPKEAHKGDPAKWQDPRAFLERSIRETPLLIKQNRKQSQIIETQNKIIESLKQNIEKERASLQPKMKEAFENADYTEFQRLQNEDRELIEQKQQYETHKIEHEEDNNPAKYAEAANNWLKNNPDYYTNETIKKEADKAFDEYVAEFPTASPDRIIEAVNMRVEKKRQSISFAGTQTTPSTMNSSNRTKEKSYNNLTESARRICDNFVNYGNKREDYLKYAEDSCFVWGKNIDN